ncbi:uncharacterized protein EDB91DRAFT_52731 [Suillus paluster]|uniref:uncharacterized protein n=1 Tax=Suillus paluster TaxID=48578 RepID=UPI001B871F02|nr:uncharacterized protein EDB91DRAFT_52731 [Suillus paluster]KAG1747980.1 hypothetical protein EDB91DRAFT_52731 [Suillus paluster]
MWPLSLMLSKWFSQPVTGSTTLIVIPDRHRTNAKHTKIYVGGKTRALKFRPGQTRQSQFPNTLTLCGLLSQCILHELLLITTGEHCKLFIQ